MAMSYLVEEKKKTHQGDFASQNNSIYQASPEGQLEVRLQEEMTVALVKPSLPHT